MKGTERVSRLRQTRIDPISHWKQFFEKAEFAGDGQAQGKLCTKLALTDAGGAKTTMCFDKETNLLARTDTNVGGQTLQIDFSDYRKVGGILAPHKMPISLSRLSFEIVATSIEYNVAIPAATFEILPDINTFMK